LFEGEYRNLKIGFIICVRKKVPRPVIINPLLRMAGISVTIEDFQSISFFVSHGEGYELLIVLRIKAL
jgi:hypothetical protein